MITPGTPSLNQDFSSSKKTRRSEQPFEGARKLNPSITRRLVGQQMSTATWVLDLLQPHPSQKHRKRLPHIIQMFLWSTQRKGWKFCTCTPVVPSVKLDHYVRMSRTTILI
eukprot:PhF_6_TR25322/c0_g1_i1/m.34984